jgi:hypothetical protein
MDQPLTLTDFQISLSTAEEEANYFTGGIQRLHEPDPAVVMPAGIYRVIDGQLYRIVPGVSPIVGTAPQLSE